MYVVHNYLCLEVFMKIKSLCTIGINIYYLGADYWQPWQTDALDVLTQCMSCVFRLLTLSNSSAVLLFWQFVQAQFCNVSLFRSSVILCITICATNMVAKWFSWWDKPHSKFWTRISISLVSSLYCLWLIKSWFKESTETETERPKCKAYF